ncbi:hypothetical protein Tco_0254845, partial [Tanacetum coccineum]
MFAVLTLDFQITQLNEKVTVLQEQNKLFRAENEKGKHHYKELYDSIKITTIDQDAPASTPSSITIDQDAPSLSHSPSSSALLSLSLHQGIAAESNFMEDNPFPPVDNDPFVNVFAPKPSSEVSSYGDFSSAESP